MVSHREVARAFVEGKKLTGSRMFTEKDEETGKWVVYSYGRHFPIAKETDIIVEGKPVVLFNKNDYSSSTSTHKSYVETAIPVNWKIIKLKGCNPHTAKETIEENKQEISELASKADRARTRKQEYQEQIRELEEQNKAIKEIIIPTILAEEI